jgi:DNA-binding response OmpR family regulator
MQRRTGGQLDLRELSVTPTLPPAHPVVLIVEDDPPIREFLELLLESEGHAVESVEGGAAALARIRRGGVDLVLLDVMLPEIDGLALCQEVRRMADPTAPHLPVVMVTALGHSEQQQAGFAVGADDYITKPFDQTTFLARVQVWLAVRERAKAAQAALAAELRARQEAEQRVLQAQLDALRLAARELAHRFNNDMVLGMGILELLRLNPETPPDIEPLLPEAIAGMDRITAALTKLYQVARVETRNTPFGPALDLEQSAARAPDATA